MIRQQYNGGYTSFNGEEYESEIDVKFAKLEEYINYNINQAFTKTNSEIQQLQVQIFELNRNQQSLEDKIEWFLTEISPIKRLIYSLNTKLLKRKYEEWRRNKC